MTSTVEARCVCRGALVLSFIASAALAQTEFDDVFFADSPLPSYEASWSTVTAPSTLTQSKDKVPVTEERALVGHASLLVEWTSQVGGDWGVAVASPGWTGHDVTLADSLVFYVYTDEPTAQDGLPCIFLEDLANVRSPRIPLASVLDGVPAGAWQRVAMPVWTFLDDPGATDLTRVKTIFFGQQNADGIEHRWLLDDIRWTGVGVVTGKDVPLIVVLGSSTASGTGASLPDSSWVGRFRRYLQGIDPKARVVNLAVGGYTSYHIREDGYVPPAGRPAPIPAHNITRALVHEPWAIVVNLPSNDVAYGYVLDEELENFDAVKALADAAHVPIWFTTAQPRNLETQRERDVLIAQTDSTLARHGSYAIDFWNGLAADDGTILPRYDSGDGIHLGDRGHALLFSRVVGAAPWSEFIGAGSHRAEH